MIVYKLWSRMTDKLIGEIFVQDNVVADVKGKYEDWTNIKKGMPLDQASRFLRNHNGQSTYVTKEDSENPETEEVPVSPEQTDNNHPQVDDDFDIPYLAGSSSDGKTIYIDRNVPHCMIKDGACAIDIYKYLTLRQVISHDAMADFGLDFKKADDIGVVAQRKSIEQDGVSYDEYAAFITPYLDASLKIENIHCMPTDLDLTPYKSEGRHDILKKFVQVCKEPEPNENIEDNKKEETKFEDPWDQAKHERGGDAELERQNEIYKDKDEAIWNNFHNDEEESLQKSVSKSKAQDQDIASGIMGKLDQNNISQYGDYIHERAPSSYELSGEKLNLNKLFRSYKNSPHHPLSTLLKFAVHRIEHRNEYANADEDQEEAMDNEILDRMKQGKASEKNGPVSVSQLRSMLKKNPEIISKLLEHQRRLHNYLKSNYPLWVKNDKINLTRGMDVKKEEVGPEHPLASYGDVPHTGFGEFMHKKKVPLNNVWYSYDLGPEAASSQNFGPENEWLVSPHEWEDTNEDVTPAVPRKHHDLSKKKVDPISSMLWKPQSGEDIMRTINSQKENVSRLLAQNLVNHPSLSVQQVNSLLNHPNYEIMNAAVGSPKVDKDALHNKIISLNRTDPNDNMVLHNFKTNVGENKITPNPETISYLIKQGNSYHDAASNPATPVEDLEHVLNGNHYNKHSALLYNPKLPKHILDKIAADPNLGDNDATKVIDHPNADKDTLKHILGQNSSFFTTSVMNSPKADDEILSHGLSHSDEDVRNAAIENPNASEKLLDAVPISKDTFGSFLNNSNTSPKKLKEIESFVQGNYPSSVPSYLSQDIKKHPNYPKDDENLEKSTKSKNLKSFLKNLKKVSKKELPVVGGLADGKKESDFDPKQLKAGTEVELEEHTKDPNIAKKIAADHLTEFPNYYSALEQMEEKLKNKKPT